MATKTKAPLKCRYCDHQKRDCDATSNHWACTRSYGHKGDHVACSLTHAKYRWPQESTSLGTVEETELTPEQEKDVSKIMELIAKLMPLAGKPLFSGTADFVQTQGCRAEEHGGDCGNFPIALRLWLDDDRVLWPGDQPEVMGETSQYRFVMVKVK